MSSNLTIKRQVASSDYDGVAMLLATHIVEVKVRRRNKKPGYGPTRRFLATNSKPFLSDVRTRTAFHFKAPSKPPAYNARSKNVIFAFDLMMSEYRAINLDRDVIVTAMPVRTEEEMLKFWDFFNVKLSKWSSSNKEMFKNM